MLRDDTEVIDRPGWHQIVTPSAPGTLLNEVVLSAVAPEDAERVIDDVIAMYRAHAHPVKWCVGPWTRPEDFGERLARRGFVSWDVRGMGCDSTLALTTPPDVRVVEVGEDGLDAYLSTAMRGWSVPADQREAERRTHLTALAEDPRRAHFFAAKRDGRCVGTAGILLRGSYGYLVGTQVLAAARGGGVYKALVAGRLAFLHDRGISFAVTHARESTSAPMLEHLGFETLFRSKCYVREL
jgi:GNAT superfamily N-acetyltransferase